LEKEDREEGVTDKYLCVVDCKEHEHKLRGILHFVMDDLSGPARTNGALPVAILANQGATTPSTAMAHRTAADNRIME
jgi:hypothetical protein